MTTLAQSFVAAIVEDPVALAELRVHLDADGPALPSDAPLAYTVATLADSLGVSAKVVRGAIRRRELDAVKSGRRWLISTEAARAWTAGEHQPTTRPRRMENVKRARAGGPSLRAVLCDSPANHSPHNGKSGG